MTKLLIHPIIKLIKDLSSVIEHYNGHFVLLCIINIYDLYYLNLMIYFNINIYIYYLNLLILWKEIIFFKRLKS